MSNLNLPARPNLEQLKKQAKELLGKIRHRDPNAVALFARHHPKPELEGGHFALHDAQLVVARQYGFATWARLKDEVERVAADFSQRVVRFVRDAVDGDFSRARRALTLEPDLARADLWAALAVGEVALIEQEVGLDPSWVNRQGGPCGDWAPLLYVSFQLPDGGHGFPTTFHGLCTAHLALNRAAEHGNLSAVRILLDCGFNIAFKGSRQWGSTPLHGSAWYGQADVVEFLLSRGAPTNTPANPPEESLPLGWAAHGSSNCRNPRGDYARVVRALLAAGATPATQHAEMASPEIAEILYAALAGKGEEAKGSTS